MQLPETAPCIICKWLTALPAGEVTCKAFPKRIPKEIIYGLNDHKKPFKGDNGIQFKRRTEAG